MALVGTLVAIFTLADVVRGMFSHTLNEILTGIEMTDEMIRAFVCLVTMGTPVASGCLAP
jgi:hypothetical protein